jgi:hypothetical protein
MSRLFSFGCSFTNYIWPTWADIAGRQFDHYENWGRMGGGNTFIFCSLLEAINRKNIGPDDTVAVMWTSISREDRWIGPDGWLTLGSIYNQTEYDQKFVKRFADPTGYLIRDLAMISGAQLALKALGCKYHFFSIVPFEYHDDSDDTNDCFFKIDQEVLDLYQSTLNQIKPSVFETVFHGDWYSRPGQVVLPDLERRYKNCAGPDWPLWPDFLINRTKHCDPIIQKEIQRQFKFERELIRTDSHPTPKEHLEYLQKQWPQLVISDSTEKWTNEVNELVMLNQSLTPLWLAKSVKRF